MAAVQDNGTDQDQAKVEANAVQPVVTKHPLHHQWVMWYDNPRRKTQQSDWEANLRHICSFDTVEDFWRLYNNIQPASNLPPGSNYHLFKEGIQPKWEDPQNTDGGKWVVCLSSKQRQDHLDKRWLWTILACVGETLEDGDEVCGAVVSIRQSQDKIAVWTRNANNEFTTVQIGMRLKQQLELPDNIVIGYQSHADAMRTNSSFNNTNKYQV